MRMVTFTIRSCLLQVNTVSGRRQCWETFSEFSGDRWACSGSIIQWITPADLWFLQPTKLTTRNWHLTFDVRLVTENWRCLALQKWLFYYHYGQFHLFNELNAFFCIQMSKIIAIHQDNLTLSTKCNKTAHQVHMQESPGFSAIFVMAGPNGLLQQLSPSRSPANHRWP